MAVPGAFSPNGDGLNDFFKLPTFAIETFFIQIFDRWGNEVFQSRNKDFLWDGNKDGSACPEGIYAYQLTANGYERQVIQKNGTITLIR
jgi:gliding motility-associated-like protein